MYDTLRRIVCDANKQLHALGLAPFTWGNVSQADRARGVFAIKPSGVPYDKLEPDKIVIVSLKDGSVVDGSFNPSSDTPTHFELYRSFPDLGAIVHTHSINASAFAQAGRAIPAYGTTHADFSYTSIPCTRALTESEVTGDYEYNTGKIISDHYREEGLDIETTPAVLVHYHAPFIFGDNAAKAVENAEILEIIAEMAIKTEQLAHGKPETIDRYLLDKHYYRKHGDNAYYGQTSQDD